MMSDDRAVTLLRATLEILNKANEGSYIEDVFSLTAHYDGADCDGFCLKEDIENYLEYELPASPRETKTNGETQ